MACYQFSIVLEHDVLSTTGKKFATYKEAAEFGSQYAAVGEIIAVERAKAKKPKAHFFYKWAHGVTEISAREAQNRLLISGKMVVPGYMRH